MASHQCRRHNPHSSRHKRVTFTYTGLSLAVPQRVRFRYFLDGFDRNWSEPTAAREAVYTNLNPGPYRFRVVACNNDGLWNGSEAAVSFRVDPAFWQTWWFMILGVMTVGLAVLTYLRLRVLSLTRQMNIRSKSGLASVPASLANSMILYCRVFRA